MPADAAVEQIPLVAQREAARAQAGGQLAQPAAGARIAHRHVDVDRSLLGPAEPRRVDPQGARVRDVGGVEVERGAIRGDLRERPRRDEPERNRQSDRPTVRPSGHYGSTATVVWVTWVTGMATPCTVKRTVSVVESRDSPPR